MPADHDRARTAVQLAFTDRLRTQWGPRPRPDLRHNAL